MPLSTDLSIQDGASFTTTNFFLSDSSNIVSIAQLTPVDYTPGTDDSLPPVFKIFSKKELSQDELSKMFRFTNTNGKNQIP